MRFEINGLFRISQIRVPCLHGTMQNPGLWRCLPPEGAGPVCPDDVPDPAGLSSLLHKSPPAAEARDFLRDRRDVHGPAGGCSDRIRSLIRKENPFSLPTASP